MTVQFYSTNDNSLKVGKTLTAVGTAKTCNIVNAFSIMNPVVTIDLSSDFLTGANMCYISEFKRFYHIDNVVMISAQRCQINMSIDVLETYKNSIKNMDATVTRSESVGMPTQITDTMLPVQTDEFEIDSLTMTNSLFNGLSIYNYVLTVQG